MKISPVYCPGKGFGEMGDFGGSAGGVEDFGASVPGGKGLTGEPAG